MNRLLRRVAVLVLAVVAIGPVTTDAGPSSDNLVELAAKGGPSLGLSLGVSPLRFDPLTPPDPLAGSTAADNALLSERERGRAVSLDVKLKWPTADLPIEPYVVLGPALLLEQPQELSGMIGLPGDQTLRLGAKAGAGFNWRLGRDATLFGSYDVTTTTVDRLSAPPARGSAASNPMGYDLLYGVRFSF